MDILSSSPSMEMLMQGFFQFEFIMLVERKVGLGRAFTRRNIYQVALVVGLHLSRWWRDLSVQSTLVNDRPSTQMYWTWSSSPFTSLLTFLCCLHVFLNQRWALVLQITNFTSVTATRKCHGKLHYRDGWKTSHSLSNYLSGFHIDDWNTA